IVARCPDDYRLIFALEAVRLDLLGEREMRGVVLRDNQQSARVLIDAVYDSRADDAVYARQVANVPEQSVYKRAVRIAGRGVDDHALRLVDDQQVGVLIHDIERYVLRLGVER